jgi:hypothetical protein
MIRLNVEKVLKHEADEKKRVKPLPKVRVVNSVVRSQEVVVSSKPQSSDAPQPLNSSTTNYSTTANSLISELWEEIGSLKRQRGKLSSSIAHQVIEQEAMLRKESPALADEFMKGNMPTVELVNLHDQIQSFTDRMALVWDKIRHVEQYGVLPSQMEVKVELQLKETSIDVAAIHQEIRRLDDLIYKCNKKLRNSNSGIKAPKNTDRVNDWKQKIALAEAKRDDLKQQKKKLEYGAREQRIGAQ